MLQKIHRAMEIIFLLYWWQNKKKILWLYNNENSKCIYYILPALWMNGPNYFKVFNTKKSEIFN